MENSVNAWVILNFYHGAVKAELKHRGFPKETAQKILSEYKTVAARAKDIGKAKLLSSYIMGIYFIAMVRSTGRSAEENFEILRDGLCASSLFHKVMGNAFPLCSSEDFFTMSTVFINVLYLSADFTMSPI